ncbi:MAG TPA: hypothetical protein VGF60_11490 [Xanthobacteraceae bacterium]|jgi:hypothetical protein
MRVRLAAVLVAALAGIVALTPIETSAGSGAPGGASLLHAGPPHPLARPFHPRFARAPFDRHLRRFSRFHDRGLGFPLWTLPAYGDCGDCYPPFPGNYPSTAELDYNPPPAAYPAYLPTPVPPAPPRIDVIPFRPGCDTETVEVPSERGGRYQRVNIVRC